MRTLFLAGVVACIAAACSGPDAKQENVGETGSNFVSAETSACISEHPAAEPFDVGDGTDVSAGSAPPALESFRAECRSAGGAGCDESFMSKEAARCIAEKERFAPGLEAWTIRLSYEASYHRLVWAVENLLEDRGADGYSGQSLTLDAVNGRVLGRTAWSAE
jgi:hypothetical protein